MTNSEDQRGKMQHGEVRRAEDQPAEAGTADSHGAPLRVWKLATALALLLALGIGVAWAISVVFLPKPAVHEADFTLVTVEQGSVEGSRAVNVQAIWSRTLVAANLAGGTVTSVSAQGASPVDAGAVLYAVDLNPVVVMPGAVPAFREMSEGAQGADVAQLQDFLQAHGYLESFDRGSWGSNTTRAVRAWQQASGIPVDGAIGAGEVVFVPALPAAIVLDTGVIRLGARLSGGEDAIFQLSHTPNFTIPVLEAQASSLQLGSRVQINAPDGGSWEAWIVDQIPRNEEAGIDMILASSPDGSNDAPICADQCGQIPLDPAGALLRSRAITVEEVTGLVVPSAAVTTTATGKTVLVGKDGTVHPITVLAGARGMTAIEGVDAGLQVRAPAEAP